MSNTRKSYQVIALNIETVEDLQIVIDQCEHIKNVLAGKSKGEVGKEQFRKPHFASTVEEMNGVIEWHYP